MSMYNRIAIVGAGPAGISAAIQLKRYGHEPIVFEKDRIGGLIKNANMIENYAGFIKSINGAQFVGSLELQCLKYALDIRPEQVLQVGYSSKRFDLKTDSNTYSSDVVVVASGTRPLSFNDFEIPPQCLKNIQYEVYPIRDSVSKHIVIVGSGDAAFDYALSLSRSNKVLILMRSATSKCIASLYKRVSENDNINIVSRACLKSLSSCNQNQICIEYWFQNLTESLNTDWLIFAIGREPDDVFLSDQILQNQAKLEDDGLLYFVGDIKNGNYRQLSIAAGDGLKAAMKINERFKSDQ